MNNCIYILLIIFSIFVICSLFSLDHFKSINSLNIKYNEKDVYIPNQLKKPTKDKLSIKEQITTELGSHPLSFKEQIWAIPNYPFVGEKKLCSKNSDCNYLTAECNKNTDLLSKESGLGVCTLRINDKTVFDVKY
jgi:hypothetical protein